MPSWNDGDETSSDERLTDYSSELPLNVPETLYDPDFCGIETTCPETCGHGDKLARLVAFEGVETGRRFLGCARSGSGICGSVYWQDLEWPPSLQHCLLRLWKLYDKECTDRLKESCESSEAYYKLNMEKKKVEQKNKELQIELGKALSDSQGKDEMIEQNKKLYLMKEMAEKERDAVKEEKKKLEYALGDLFNAAEKNKQKLKKIKLILEE